MREDEETLVKHNRWKNGLEVEKMMNTMEIYGIRSASDDGIGRVS